jgi:hypothetical protein
MAGHCLYLRVLLYMAAAGFPCTCQVHVSCGKRVVLTAASLEAVVSTRIIGNSKPAGTGRKHSLESASIALSTAALLLRQQLSLAARARVIACLSFRVACHPRPEDIVSLPAR